MTYIFNRKHRDRYISEILEIGNGNKVRIGNISDESGIFRSLIGEAKKFRSMPSFLMIKATSLNKSSSGSFCLNSLIIKLTVPAYVYFLSDLISGGGFKPAPNDFLFLSK